MSRIEKTVFISYRRQSVPWALAVYQGLTNRGYDVFFDYEGIGSGDFEQIILENIRARAHFLVLLTPSALERIDEPGDWLRREIETALETQRNIVPLMFEGFDFGTPAVASRLTGTLGALRRYNGLPIVASYFQEGMDRLCQQRLNLRLDTLAHPPSPAAVEAAKQQQAAAASAPHVNEVQLTAEQWYERGVEASEPKEQIRCFTEVIRLRPTHARAYQRRGDVRISSGDPRVILRVHSRTTTRRCGSILSVARPVTSKRPFLSDSATSREPRQKATRRFASNRARQTTRCAGIFDSIATT